MQTKKLSIPEWHELAESGAVIPMRIPINGVSMVPLIRRNRDMVTIMPMSGSVVPGDIVMFADPMRNRFVLHRVWRVKDGCVQTWGDNCDHDDGWMPVELIWGKTVKIERGKRVIVPEPVRGMRWAKCWHVLGRWYRKTHRLAAHVYHGVKRRLGAS